MRKITKSAITFFILLTIAAIPLYYSTRPDWMQTADSLQLKGNVQNPHVITFAELKAMVPVTIEVILSSTSRQEDNGNFSYTGVLLSDLLNRAKIHSNATTVFIQSMDSYGATITNVEIQSQKTILAYSKDGEKLSDLRRGGEGPLRLVIGEDLYAQRWVRGVVAIEVI